MSSIPVLRLSRAFAAAAIVLGASACTDDSEPDPPDPCEGLPPDSEACLNARYLPPGALSTARCTGPTSSQRIGDRKEVAFFRGRAAPDAALTSYGRELQGYFEPYGLSFFTRTAPQQTELEYAFSGTDEDFARIDQEVGIVPGEEPTPAPKARLDELVHEVLFGPLRAFIAAQSQPPQARVHIVVLGQLASPDVARQLYYVLGGLGLSPRLFREVAKDDPSKNMFDLLGLPPDFTPTLFLGHSDIARFKTNRETVVAHEMGHALGLQHTTAGGNLMVRWESLHRCTPVLNDEQIGQLAQGLGLDAARESYERLFELRRRFVERVVHRRR